MVRLTTVGDPIEARIIAARLGSEGVLWELRGGIDGPYPMGPFHVYVAEPDLATAHEVLTPADDHDPFHDLDQDAEHDPDHGPGAGGDAHDGRAPLALWLVVLAIVALAAFGIARVAMSSDPCAPDGARSTVRCTDQPEPVSP
jgi:hypothetical protein